MYKTILVPLDGSKRAEAILSHVEQLAQRYTAKVIFLQVVQPFATFLESDTASADLYDNTQRHHLFKAYGNGFRIISSDLPNFKVAEPDWLKFKGRWGQYEKLHDEIHFRAAGIPISVYHYKEVGWGPRGPKQHKESWNKGDFHGAN